MTSWERANIQAAASYLRERMTQGALDAKTKAVYEGLLEVLDPTRRTARALSSRGRRSNCKRDKDGSPRCSPWRR